MAGHRVPHSPVGQILGPAPAEKKKKKLRFWRDAQSTTCGGSTACRRLPLCGRRGRPPSTGEIAEFPTSDYTQAGLAGRLTSHGSDGIEFEASFHGAAPSVYYGRPWRLAAGPRLLACALFYFSLLLVFSIGGFHRGPDGALEMRCRRISVSRPSLNSSCCITAIGHAMPCQAAAASPVFSRTRIRFRQLRLPFDLDSCSHPSARLLIGSGSQCWRTSRRRSLVSHAIDQLGSLGRTAP
jgi:hypothetical protein